MTSSEKKLQRILINAYTEICKLPQTMKVKRIKKELEKELQKL